MIGLLCFALAVLASPFKSKLRLEAENTVLRHQLIVLRRRLPGRVPLTNRRAALRIILHAPRVVPDAVPYQTSRLSGRCDERGGVWAPASDTIRIAGEAISPNATAYPKRARAISSSRFAALLHVAKFPESGY